MHNPQTKQQQQMNNGAKYHDICADRIQGERERALTFGSMGEGKFLLVKGITGLGDRILCALGGILYARLSERTLVVDWSDSLYSSGGVNVSHRFFKSQSCSPTDDIPTTDSVYPAIWRDRLYEPAQRIAEKYGHNPDGILRELSIDLSRLDYQEDLLVLVQFHAGVDA